MKAEWNQSLSQNWLVLWLIAVSDYSQPIHRDFKPRTDHTSWPLKIFLSIMHQFKNNVLYVDYIGSESHSCYQIMVVLIVELCIKEPEVAILPARTGSTRRNYG